MKPFRLLALLFSVFVFAQSCKKDAATGTELPKPQKGERVKRSHGQPTGTVSKATISTGGGTLVSADGRLILTIPAGAVEAATEFSIQPVTNALQTTGLAYRLLPEGVAFKKDVTVTYSYSGLTTIDGRYLFLAYQDAAGNYFSLPQTQHLAATKTLSAQTKHFSDWTFYTTVELKTDRTLVNGVARMKRNETMRLEAKKYYADKGTTNDAYTGGAPLMEDILFGTLARFQWALSSPKGTLTVSSNKSVADYKAPAQIDRQENLVANVTINDADLGIDNLGQPVRQIILGQEIALEPENDEYFYLLGEGSSEQSLKNLTANYIPSWISIGGYTADNRPLALYIFAAGTGTFSYGLAGEPNKVQAEYTHGANENFVSFKPTDCNGGSSLQYSSGTVRLTKIAQAVGEYTEGEFTAGLFRTDYCNTPGSKNISGRFKILKRS